MMQEENRSKDKSLAWFKLADLIARGEREKALNVFRLLSHSFNDRAYVLQLEGDILWYLDDQGFTDRYKQAAFLYKKEKRWIDAIAIYEHLLTQDPQSTDTLFTLMVFYCMVDWQDRLQERFEQLIVLASNDQVKKYLKQLCEAVQEADDQAKNKWFNSWLDNALKLAKLSALE